MGVHALCYLALNAVEGTAADEQDVACVDMCIVLVRMLAATLWRHVDHRSLKELEQALLHTLAANVACDARVVALACYLVDLVNEDNALLGSLDVVVGNLKQS